MGAVKTFIQQMNDIEDSARGCQPLDLVRIHDKYDYLMHMVKDGWLLPKHAILIFEGMVLDAKNRSASDAIH